MDKESIIDLVRNTFNLSPKEEVTTDEKVDDRWVVVARAERGYLPKGLKRFTSEYLKRTAENYDPDFRTAKIVCGWDEELGIALPGHQGGRLTRPVSEVKSLDFDGINLYAKVPVTERLRSLTEKGFDRYSVLIGQGVTGMDDPNEPYLGHVALLGGENPAIPAMPPLGEMLRSEGMATGEMRTIASSLLEDEKPDTLTIEEAQMTVEETLDKIMAKVDALAERLEATETSAAAAAEEAKGAAAAAEEARSEVQSITQKAELATVEQRLERLVKEGKVQPKERTAFTNFIEKSEAPPEAIAEFLDEVEQREASIPADLTEETTAPGRSGNSLIERAGFLPEVTDKVSPVSMALYRKASEGASTPEEFRANAYKLAGEVRGSAEPVGNEE
jgi:hypothetical protein